MSLISTAVASRSSFFTQGGVVTLISFSALTANFLFASDHDLQRCVELSTLCVAAILFIVRAAKGNLPAPPGASGNFILLFFALGLASVSSAYSLRYAVYEWSTFLLLLVLVFTIATELVQDVRRLNRLLLWVGIACGLYSLRVLVMYAAALATGFQPDWSVLSVGFSNPRFLNHTQTPLLPLIILLCVTAPRDGSWRKAWFALGAFWWALLFATEGRASVLALTVGCVVALILRRSQARQFLTTMALTALAGALVYGLIFVLLPIMFGLLPVGSPSNVLARTMANPASNRFLLWNLALKLIAVHPWLGVGPHHFAHEGATLYAGAHPHDWILQIAAEWGIPALLCLTGAIFFSGRALVLNGKRIVTGEVAGQQMQAALLVTCTGIFIDALFSGVLVMPQSQLAIALVLGIACAWVRMHGAATNQAPPKRSAASRVLLAGLVAAGLCALIWSVAPSLVRHATGEALTPAELALNPTVHWSRMWEAGYF